MGEMKTLYDRGEEKPDTTPKPRKKYNIDMDLPEFKFIDLSEAGGLAFGKRGKEPKFLPIIKQLMSKPDKALMLPNPKYRQSVLTAAKKVGVALLFAESDGKLYVKMVKPHKESTALRDLIADKPRGIAELCDIMANRGSNMIVRNELQALSGAGVIKLNTTTKLWEITNFGRTWEPAK